VRWPAPRARMHSRSWSAHGRPMGPRRSATRRRRRQRRRKSACRTIPRTARASAWTACSTSASCART
jgi:hypothetical protein